MTKYHARPAIDQAIMDLRDAVLEIEPIRKGMPMIEPERKFRGFNGATLLQAWKPVRAIRDESKGE